MEMYEDFRRLAEHYHFIAGLYRKRADQCKANMDEDNAAYLLDIAERYDGVGWEIQTILFKDKK